MQQVHHSQLAPLPTELPFLIISQTIGSGAYACIKRARPLDQPSPVFAVKFIHKRYAVKAGNVTIKQLNLEVSLHKHLGQHANIVQFFKSGEDATWRWVAMELAEGGDLFDKIESDLGVGEDVAHVYFTQLINAVAFMHSKGVAHRDLKPENILLSAEGNLKVADFGLATLFQYQGQRKKCTTSCGSPPYTAPEIVTCSGSSLLEKRKIGEGYYGDVADIWSCAVVLFVLLVGNTPWEVPLTSDYYFNEFMSSDGRPNDALWQTLPSESLSLIRGMMKLEPASRFSLDEVRRHPWFTRPNKYLDGGKITNPVALATQMFESLRIDFSQDPLALSQPRTEGDSDAMDLDEVSVSRVSATQPETPTADIIFDWEKPSFQTGKELISASQPISNGSTNGPLSHPMLLSDRLAEEPSFSQFSVHPAVPLSRTQMAHQFRDILPSHSLTSFFSLWDFPALLPTLLGALHRLNVPTIPLPQRVLNGQEDTVHVKLKTIDTKKCLLNGDIAVERGDGLIEIRFVKSSGDPVEFRRLFKKVVILCQDAVYKSDE
ncbi:Chk1 protein kinase [Agyrium rufum]|nr:Chk1 protein kinase [Agyrium rufum]